MKNPHLPVEPDNLEDPSLWNVIEQLDHERVRYAFRVEPYTKTAYLSLKRAELMRIYDNRPPL